MKYKILIKVNIILLFLLIFVGCSTSSDEIENTVETVLDIDIPPDFKVVDDDKWFAISNIGITYIIEFDDKGFSYILSQLDMSNWNEVSSNYYEYTLTEQDSIVVFLLIKERRIKYMYFD